MCLECHFDRFNSRLTEISFDFRFFSCANKPLSLTYIDITVPMILKSSSCSSSSWFAIFSNLICRTEFCLMLLLVALSLFGYILAQDVCPLCKLVCVCVCACVIRRQIVDSLLFYFVS